MDHHRQNKKTRFTTSTSEEVSSIEWEFIYMTEQEEDLIFRMHRLVGERWDLIAGRIPGRRAEEIERFWIMRHHADMFSERRKQRSKENSKQLDHGRRNTNSFK